MSNRLTRRTFLKTAGVAGAVGFWGGRISGAPKKTSANERLHVGVIGVRGQGSHDMNGVAGGGAVITALCDVDEEVLARAHDVHPKAQVYTDFRRLLEQKDIDGVVVGTPDHWHAPITLRALKAGLHVLCEKPLTHTVAEARLVAETAAKERRVTQMGTQIHAGSNYRRAVELIRSNVIGAVKEVHVWVGTVWCGVGGALRDYPSVAKPVPKGLHFDLWLGPAPVHPYDPEFHHYVWRGWWDFGGGALADMACHYMDLPFWALQLRHPEKVSAEGPPVHAANAGRDLVVRYEFAARPNLPAVKLTWYDGARRPALLKERNVPDWGSGVLFVGEKGMLLADYGRHQLLPEKDFAGFVPPKPFIPESVGHYREWVDACKTSGPTTCSFDYGGALTEAVLLGNVSYRLGKPITWDAKALRAVNEPEAERLIHKEYRKPYTLS
jgi:predicted dehydrogenase